MRLPLPILALAIASFGIGTTEFVIMGLLPDVAASFGVTVPQAGYLVSGYALGVVVGAPIVAMATARLPRKTALLSLLAIFLLGNLGCALAPSYFLLLLARIVTAFAHGAFFGIGAVVARDLVAPSRRTQAVALMFTGLTLANVLGVPLGTALGQQAGWRAAFWAVTAIGALAAAAVAAFIPATLPGSTARLATEFRALGRWTVLRPMLASTIASLSLFSVFTYITPLLEDVTGLTPHGVTGALLAIGVGLTLGNLAGGHFADRNQRATILASFADLILVLLLLGLLARHPLPALVLLTLWGALAFALVSPLQIWVLEAATDAPNLASTLNQGAFNLGNAAGAWLGGLALTLGAGYASLPVPALALAAAALPGTARAATPIPVAYIPILAMAQLFVIVGEGWAAQAGLDLKLTRFSSGPAMVQALASGSYPVSYIGIGPAMVARAAGLDIKVVAANGIEQGALIGVGDFAAGFDPANPAASFAAFRQKAGRPVRIATLPKGSVPDTVLRYWLNEVAHIPEADVQVQGIGEDRVQQALLAGSVDAGGILEPILTIVQERLPSARILATGHQLFPNQPGAAICIREAFLRSDHAAAETLVALHVRATKLIVADPARAARDTLAIIGTGLVSEETLTHAYRSPALHPIANPHDIFASTAKLAAYQLKLGSLARDVPAAELFDTSLYDALPADQK